MSQNPKESLPADKIESIFLAAVALPNPADRSTYVEQACGGDENIRGEVEALLRAHDLANHLLDRPVPATLGQSQIFSSREQQGTVIVGRYKLLESIGEGGMGAVWVAEQIEPVRRKVAVKLIKAGMDSKSVLARFEAERQALAVMDHPNIAKVLDGGITESGRPYFVMEYVKGIPITEYCDAKRLNVHDRLSLFTEVCQAVQHAHQKGIIHRDLKPSNVLVAPYDDRPVPKVIDFGLAKATHQSLTEKTLHTAHGMVLGTPQYMSPEQAQLNNLDVDTRSDIYSLGVLLYELLTGSTPLETQRYQQAAWDEVRRIIREEDPPRPSRRLSTAQTLPSLAASRQVDPARLTKLMQGELDWIVMKSLEKDRVRRYETASGFAADVQRYLDGEPVQAAPHSMNYLLRKFMTRHKAVLSSVTAIGLILVTASMVSTWQAVRAWEAEAVARQSQQAEAKRAKEEQRQRKLAIAAKDEAQRQRDLADKRQKEAVLGGEKLRGALYASNMNLVQSAWDNEQFFQMEMLLNEQQKTEGEADNRGWEWYFWKRRMVHGLIQDNPPPISLKPNSPESASQIAVDLFFSGDGSRIVSHCYAKNNSTLLEVTYKNGTGEIVIHDRRDSREQLRFRPFPELTGPLKDGLVSCNYDCSRIAIYQECDESRLAIFDGSTGKSICELSISASPDAINFDRTGNRMLAAFTIPPVDADADDKGMQKLQVWDIPSGEVVFTDTQTAVQETRYATISPDGSKLLRYTEHDGTGEDKNRNQLEMIALPSGDLIWKQQYPDSRMEFDDWSPNGLVVAFSQFNPDQRLPITTLWDAKTGKVFATFPRKEMNKYQRRVALSPNGKVLAQFHHSAIQLFHVPSMDVVDGQEIGSKRPFAVFPSSLLPREVVFSGDGEEIIAMTSAPVRGDVRIKAWNVTAAPFAKTVLLTPPSWEGFYAEFSPNGDRLAFCDDSRTHTNVWDIGSQKLIGNYELERATTSSYDRYYNFSRNGRRLMTKYKNYNGSLRLWVHDLDSGLAVWNYSVIGRPRSAPNADLDPMGDRVLTVETQNDESGTIVSSIRVWDVRTGKLLRSHDEPGNARDAFFIKDGGEIALLITEPNITEPKKRQKYVRVFDSETFERISSNSTSLDVNLHDAGHEWLANTMNANADTILYDLRSGEERNRFRGMRLPRLITQSPHGNRIAISTTLEDWVSLGSLESNQRLLNLNVPGSKDIAFSADGNRLLVAHLTAQKELAITTWDATPMTNSEPRRHGQ